MHVVIIGAGWAGLAAAVELTRAGRRVTLVEAAAQPGGRARRVTTRGGAFDNGQHLMLGAYSELLRLLRDIGVTEEQVLLRRRLSLEMRSPWRKTTRLDLPALPAPWHVMAGLLTAGGLSGEERYRALTLCGHLLFSGFKRERDLDVARWLQARKQPLSLIKALWEPLCLATLNTPLEHASTRVFIRVLREVFAGRRSDSDMLFPRTDLSAVFPGPAARFVQARGGELRFGERVTALNIRAGRVHGIVTRRDTYAADAVIVAVPPSECLRLIQAHAPLDDLMQRLSTLRYEPICTIYFQYPPEIRLGTEMIGLLDGPGQWILDLALPGRPGRMAVVISGPGAHMAWDNDTLIAHIRDQLQEHFPQWPEPSHSLVIREKRATFSCHAGIEAQRPAARTGVEGLWLAGDYTDTGFPATLEGALRSGVRCAREIIAERAAG